MQSAVMSDNPTEISESWEKRYPDIKPSIPRAELVNCTVCFKPGYKYIKNSSGNRFMYYVHYNEPAIGVHVKKNNADGTQHMRFNYRTCYKDGRLYHSLEQALKSQQKSPKSETATAFKPKITDVPKRIIKQSKRKHRKSIIVECECGKDGTANIIINKKHPNNKPQFQILHKEKNEAGHNIAHYQKTIEKQEEIRKQLESQIVQQKTQNPRNRKRNTIHNKLMLCYCGREGYPSRFNDKGITRYNITHEERIASGDHLRHNIKTLESKEQAITILGPLQKDIRVLEQLLERDNKSAPSLIQPNLEQQSVSDKNKMIGMLRRHRSESDELIRRHRNEIDELIQDLNNK